MSTRLAARFGSDELTVNEKLKIYTVFIDQPDNGIDSSGHEIVRSDQDTDSPDQDTDSPDRKAYHAAVRMEETPVEPSRNPISIARQYPAATLYEREIQDMHGIFFSDIPDDRPLVFHNGLPASGHPLIKEQASLASSAFHSDHPDVSLRYSVPYVFVRGEGVGIYEIPVGPVHAGIIEPGHFRFTAVGEHVLNLETRLFYKHRGIEKLAEGKGLTDVLPLVGSIAGDEAVSNTWAYCAALEEIMSVEVSERSQFIRQFLQEIERISSHLNDLTGMATDVAFGVASMLSSSLREEVLHIANNLTGSRYLRGVVVPGGVNSCVSNAAVEETARTIMEIEPGVREFQALMFNNMSVVNRLEGTGTLEKIHAERLGVVGPVARASSISYDVRRDLTDKLHSSARLRDLLSELEIPIVSSGDCYGRTKVRIEEIFASLKIIQNVARHLPVQHPQVVLPDNVEPFKKAIGITEAPRGETLHFLMTGETGKEIYRYHPRTPSRANWQALPFAFDGDIVADFPLVNKSFNLSYAGNDL